METKEQQDQVINSNKTFVKSEEAIFNPSQHINTIIQQTYQEKATHLN